MRASNAWITPENPLAGEWATVHFDASGGPLATSAHVYIYRGFNHWAQVAAPDQRMTRDAVTGVYAFAYEVPEAAFEINCVFNNGTGDGNEADSIRATGLLLSVLHNCAGRVDPWIQECVDLTLARLHGVGQVQKATNDL